MPPSVTNTSRRGSGRGAKRILRLELPVRVVVLPLWLRSEAEVVEADAETMSSDEEVEDADECVENEEGHALAPPAVRALGPALGPAPTDEGSDSKYVPRFGELGAEEAGDGVE